MLKISRPNIIQYKIYSPDTQIHPTTCPSVLSIPWKWPGICSPTSGNFTFKSEYLCKVELFLEQEKQSQTPFLAATHFSHNWGSKKSNQVIILSPTPYLTQPHLFSHLHRFFLTRFSRQAWAGHFPSDFFLHLFLKKTSGDKWQGNLWTGKPSHHPTNSLKALKQQLFPLYILYAEHRKH